MSFVVTTTSGQMKIRPGFGKREHAERHQAGFAQRQNDADIDPELVGAVDARGFEQFIRDRHDHRFRCVG
jgi:hypothetical protein